MVGGGFLIKWKNQTCCLWCLSVWFKLLKKFNRHYLIFLPFRPSFLCQRPLLGAIPESKLWLYRWPNYCVIHCSISGCCSISKFLTWPTLPIWTATFLVMVRFPSFSPNQRFLFGLPIGRAFSGWIDTVPTTHCASWGIERWRREGKEDTKLVRRTSEFDLRNGIFSVIVALDHNPSTALVLDFSHDLRWNHWQDHM